MSFAVLFPGQGSQYAGMNKALLENFSWTKQVYEEASDSIQANLLKLCLEGPDDDLLLTHNAQPAILTTSYAWFQVLKKELDFAPIVGAGHSLGEYTALLASGALTLSEVVPLVRERGNLMQTAVPQGQGKMAAIIGGEDAVVEALCAQASEGDSIVVPANYNSPGQLVVAGHAEAVDRAEALAKTPEFKVRRFVPLKVSAPFHSPLMKPVCEGLRPHLKNVAWKKPQFPIAFNVDAQVKTDADIANLLEKQIYSPVRWTKCVEAIQTQFKPEFVEVGPGTVLAGLVKRILADCKPVTIETIEGFREFEKRVRG